MKNLFVAALLLLLSACASVATMPAAKAPSPQDYVLVGRSPAGDVIVTLREIPCAPEVLIHIPAEWQKHFKGGDSIFDGKPYKACWAEPGDGTYVLMFEDGGHGRVPMSQFKKEPSV